MSTHNMLSWRNKKNINTFGLKKKHLIKSYAQIIWKNYSLFKTPIYFLSPAFSKKSGGTLFLVFRGAWCVVRGAWRVVRGAWRVVRGAWCVVPSF